MALLLNTLPPFLFSQHKFSYNLFPGTYNLYSSVPINLNPSCSLILRRHKYCVWPASINGYSCFIRWNSCPYHIFEIASDFCISDTISSPYFLTIDKSSSTTQSISRLLWFLLWSGRLGWWYTIRATGV